MKAAASLLLFLALSACSGTDHPLPVAHGPVFQLNPTRWVATSADLVAPPEVTR